ncbi:uncharacterized protein AC631_05526 [Debaryomyces fabryi]|uniref:Uncharacterized protein n=1 Tax=Debaryomyces fabryi TaxID=58627 RepID=A0A0V1PR45_9ASCO|nr:uncharacterized protein AC631_05526 [Debaryomyces fabryi]KRZ98709.1 hypothetical protein AC631_05526 [Debaryomyces fabryi]
MASSLSVQNEAPSTSTDIQTTIVTVTFCYRDQCSEIPVTTGVTVVTEEETVYLRSKPIKSAFFAPAMFMQNFIAEFGPRQLGDGTYGILYLIQIKECLLLILRAIPENMLALFLQIQIDMREK